MKKLLSLLLAVMLLFSALSAGATAQAASLTYAETAIENIQKSSGFIPGGSAIVKGNCYGFISEVCKKLFGKAYQEELESYTCKHRTGLYYEVAKTTVGSNVSAGSGDMKNLIAFIKNNAMPGDVIHYASLSNPGSKHTIMVQSIDKDKIKIYHSNWNSSSTCQTDLIYWSKLQNADTDGSRNVIFTSKMKYGGLGISVNRFTNYSSLYYNTGTAVDIAPTVSFSRSSCTSVRASWNPVSGATKYQVNYKEINESSYKMASNNVTTNFFDLTGLETGKTYDIRVRAYAGRWMSFSPTKTIMALPPEPTDGSIALKDKGVALAWGSMSDVTGVRVYKKNANGAYTVIKEFTSPAETSYLDTDITYGKTYDYKLQRYLTKNGRTYGSGGVAYSITYSLKTPSLIYDRNSATSVDITAGTDGRQTKLVYYAECDGKKAVQNTETENTTFTLSSLKVGKQYTVYVAEKTSVGRGDWAKVTLTALPKTVENVRACGLSDGLRILYDTLPDVSGYMVYRSESADGPFEKIGTVSGKDNGYYNDKKLKINTTYYYKVAGYITKDGKTYGGDMLDDSLKTGYNVTVPAGLKATPTSATAMTVSYKAAIHNQSYTLQYYVDGGRWQTVKNITGLSYTVKGLQTGKTYHFRVCAVNTTLGAGNYSAVKTVKMMPPAPTVKSAKKVTGGVKVTYTKVDGVSGYAVFRATSKNGTYKKIAVVANPKTTTYTDKTVKKNKTYYYKVWCYVNKDGNLYRSAKSAPLKVKYK